MQQELLSFFNLSSGGLVLAMFNYDNCIIDNIGELGELILPRLLLICSSGPSAKKVLFLSSRQSRKQSKCAGEGLIVCIT